MKKGKKKKICAKNKRIRELKEKKILKRLKEKTISAKKKKTDFSAPEEITITTISLTETTLLITKLDAKIEIATTLILTIIEIITIPTLTPITTLLLTPKAEILMHKATKDHTMFLPRTGA